MIRNMMIEDFDDVFEMMRVFYDSPAVLHKASDDILRKDISDCIGECPYIKGYIFEHNGKCAGYSMVAKGYSTEFGGICLWIEDLYIKPEFRGLGLSSEFFDYIEKDNEDEAVRIRLEVETENDHAIVVYKKKGYEQSPYNVMDKCI